MTRHRTAGWYTIRPQRESGGGHTKQRGNTMEGRTGPAVLRRLLDDHYLSIAKLSRQTGLHRNTITSWLTEANTPSVDNLRKVCGQFPDDDAAELAEAFGYPNLNSHLAAIADIAETIAGHDDEDPRKLLDTAIEALIRLRDVLARDAVMCF